MVDLDCLSGLSEFYGGEARVNGDIAPERLSVYKGEVTPSLSGHIDPMKTPFHQHPVALTVVRARVGSGATTHPACDSPAGASPHGLIRLLLPDQASSTASDEDRSR